MIRVNVTTLSDQIRSMEITGHAEFLEHGQDIVCAAVSLTGTGLLNALDQMCPGQCELVLGDNRIYIKVLENSEKVQNVLHTGMIQLETLIERFPKYVEKKKTEEKL